MNPKDKTARIRIQIEQDQIRIMKMFRQSLRSMVSRPKIRELFISNFFTVCEDIYLNDKCTDQLISQTIYLSLMD